MKYLIHKIKMSNYNKMKKSKLIEIIGKLKEENEELKEKIFDLENACIQLS